MNYEKTFYAHLVDYDDLCDLISGLPVEEKDQTELVEAFQKTLHIGVITFVLDELPEDHHQEFISQLEEKPHEPALMVYLQRSIENLDHRLERLAHNVKHDFFDAVHDYVQTSEEWFEGL